MSSTGVSNKIKSFMNDGSWIRKMFEDGIVLKQKYGDQNVFDLSLGNPILEPPAEFFSELRKIADLPIKGMHRYMPNNGYVETRLSVASELKNETGFDFTPDQILMTCGAGGGLNVVMKTLLDRDDEVIIFSPYFVEYIFYADNHGAKCKTVNTDNKFYPNVEDLESKISAKTKIVMINSPNNPTGVVYNYDILSKISKIIRQKENQYATKIFLVSDEPYRKILFDQVIYPNIFQFHPRTIVVTSHSKDLGLPGERIGFVAINPNCECKDELMDGLTFCNRILGFVNAPAIMQHIVKHLQSVTIDISDYQNKRDFLFGKLTEIGYSIVKPEGAFYMFPSSPIDDDMKFVSELRENRVLAVPGSGFGSPGHFRIAYCVDMTTLENSIPAFKAAFETFH